MSIVWDLAYFLFQCQRIMVKKTHKVNEKTCKEGMPIFLMASCECD